MCTVISRASPLKPHCCEHTEVWRNPQGANPPRKKSPNRAEREQPHFSGFEPSQKSFGSAALPRALHRRRDFSVARNGFHNSERQGHSVCPSSRKLQRSSLLK